LLKGRLVQYEWQDRPDRATHQLQRECHVLLLSLVHCSLIVTDIVRIIAAVLDLQAPSTLSQHPNRHNLRTLKLLELLQRIDSGDPDEYVLLDRLHLDTVTTASPRDTRTIVLRHARMLSTISGMLMGPLQA
jgi:hypothetical protein